MFTIIDEQSKFEVNLSTHEILTKLEENLDLKGWKRVSNSDSPLNLKIKIKTSFKSWGETLFINITRSDSNKSIVEVISKPVFFATLIDYGKNRRNINTVKDVFNISY